MQPRVSAGGGLAATLYSWRLGAKAGGFVRLLRRLTARNACKTCAVGMSGMRNEAGHFPEICKKSFQAQAGDMQAAAPEAFFTDTPFDLLELWTPRQLEEAGRLAFPLLAAPGDRRYRRIGWDEALERASTALREASPTAWFLYLSGRSSNEAAFLAQLFARAHGTPNIHNCSFYCHQASGVALSKVYGSGTASVVLDDLPRADVAIVIGANPASNHPRLITQLVELKRRGGRVIVVNPLRELGLERFRIPSDWRSFIFGSRIADLYVQPHVGGDVAFAKAVLKGVIERGAVARTFVEAHTRGFEAVRADVASASWDELVAASGVSKAEIDAVVEIVAAAERGIAMWAMGLTHHQHGVDNVLALANLALARGWLGHEGAGLLPIRGHSNVQGIGSVGVAPALKEAFAKKLEQLYGIEASRQPGQDTFASMQAAAAGGIRAALSFGGNLYGSNPDAAWAKRALAAIDTVVYVSTKLNTGHVHGRGKTTLVLPALVRDEEQQWTTQESMFNFVRVSAGGEPLVAGEMRSEVEIIASLAERVLPPGRFDWAALRSHDALRRAIAACVPGYAPLAAVSQKDGAQPEFQVEGRTFHTAPFVTEDGRARFHVTPLPQAPGGDFRLMTLRSEGQFNTVVYDEEDLYRGAPARDVVLMSSDDAARLGVREGDRVLVATDAGELEVSVCLSRIRSGSLAMYYPEANVLVPGKIDPLSKTPAFKSIAATVRPAGAAKGRLPLVASS